MNLLNSAGVREFSHKASISPNTPVLLAALAPPASFPLAGALAPEVEDEVLLVTYTHEKKMDLKQVKVVTIIH